MTAKFTLGFEKFADANPHLDLEPRLNEKRLVFDTVVQPVMAHGGVPGVLVNFDGSPLGTQLVTSKPLHLPELQLAEPVTPSTGEQLYAIDISNYTGSLTPERVAALQGAGVAVVIVRASLETRRDQQSIAQQQLGMLLANSVAYQAYAWCYWDWDPRWTVDTTVVMLEPYRVGYFSTPGVGTVLWLDVEEAPSPSVDEQQWLRLAVDRVRAAGYIPGIYTGAWWWNAHMAGVTEFAGLPLWVADYDRDPNVETFKPFGGWVRAVVDQYDGTSTVGGVGNVDQNVINA